ncbi:MAG: MFS transporter [Sporichthyaceae bacterium]
MRYGRSALTVIAIAVGLVVSQQLVLSIALPQISADLQASQSDLQWIVDSYPVVLAALLLPGGALGDRYGRRLLLVVGLVLMAGTNVGLALAGSPESAIAWRIACAFGAALVFPATLSSLTTAFSGEQRSKAVAIWSIAAIVGAFVGMLGAGLLIEFWSWRSICWGSAGLAAALIPAVVFTVPEAERNPKVVLDPIGSIQVVLGIGATAYGIISAGTHGLLDPQAAPVLLFGLACTAAFVRRQWFAHRPLLDVRKLADVTVGIGMVGTTALFFACYSTAFVTIQYLSIVQGLSALQIGITLMAYTPLLVPLTFVSVRVARRVGPGPMVVAGLLVIAATDLLFARLAVDDGMGAYIVLAILFGAGIGLMQAPATECVVAALPPEEQGLASAVSDITRELGAALGIAISGAVLTANLEPGRSPAEIFMTGWAETCIALAIAAAACAAGTAVLQRRAPRPVRRRGRHAAVPVDRRGRRTSAVPVPAETPVPSTPTTGRVPEPVGAAD